MTQSEWPPREVRLSSDKRVLFLTKDLELIRKQLYEGLDLRMEDLSVDDLLDDIGLAYPALNGVATDKQPIKPAIGFQDLHEICVINSLDLEHDRRVQVRRTN